MKTKNIEERTEEKAQEKISENTEETVKSAMENAEESVEAKMPLEPVLENADCKDGDCTCGNCDGETVVKKRKLTKKKKVLLIISIVLIVVIIISAITVKFVVFNDTQFEVDIDKIKQNNTLTFNDEFNGTEINRNAWLVEQYMDDNGNLSPRRGGYWVDKAVSVKDGNLVITTKKDGDKWITGAVSSLKGEGREGFEQTYGYYETRCKIPGGYGIWSAFWLLSEEFGNATDKDSSKWGAEIDIFESPRWPENRVQQALHVGGYSKHHSSTFNPRWFAIDQYSNIYDEYHTYGLYWDEDVYKFYVDGVCKWTTNYGNNVSKVNEYIILSVEIGGSDGKPAPNWGSGVITDNKEGDSYQSEFVIDYVKVWNIIK